MYLDRVRKLTCFPSSGVKARRALFLNYLFRGFCCVYLQHVKQPSGRQQCFLGLLLTIVTIGKNYQSSADGAGDLIFHQESHTYQSESVSYLLCKGSSFSLPLLFLILLTCWTQKLFCCRMPFLLNAIMFVRTFSLSL